MGNQMVYRAKAVLSGCSAVSSARQVPAAVAQPSSSSSESAAAEAGAAAGGGAGAGAGAAAARFILISVIETVSPVAARASSGRVKRRARPVGRSGRMWNEVSSAPGASKRTKSHLR